jgi:HEAT repeat protein
MACLALGRIGVASDEVIAALEYGLRYTNSWVHENAAIALAALGTNAAAALPALILSLSETNLRARVQIVNTLGGMGPAARAALPTLRDIQTNPPATLAIKLNVADDEKWGILWLRAAAIRAIAQIDPLDTSVLDSFLDFALVDYAGRQIISRHSSAHTLVPELERRLATNSNVFPWMAELLGRIDSKHPAALAALERGMASTNSSARAYAAFWHWKLTGDAPPTLKILAEGLDEPAGPTSQAFPQWLGDMGPAARPAVPALMKALWHHDLYTRRNVAVALEKIAPAALKDCCR